MLLVHRTRLYRVASVKQPFCFKHFYKLAVISNQSCSNLNIRDGIKRKDKKGMVEDVLVMRAVAVKVVYDVHFQSSCLCLILQILRTILVS